MMNFLSKSKNTQGVILAIVGALMFSSKAILVKFCYGYGLDKLSLLFLRMSFALPVYVLIALVQQRKSQTNNLSKKDWLILVVIGIIGYYFASFLDFWGLQYIGAGLERLILFLYPTMTVILGAIILKKKIKRVQVLAIVIAYLGIGIAFFDQINAVHNDNFWFGSLLVFLSALTFSFYLIGSEKLVTKLGVLKFTSYCMVISCVAVIIHFNIQSTTSIFSYRWEAYAVALCVAVFNTIIPSFIISSAIYRIGSAKTSILSSVGPVFVLIVAAIFLGESITVAKVIGAFVVIAGVWLISKGKK
ncbi:MAG: drug/metabolite transporter (DMT)-like permease [Glaciecola sp.]|jgi:drug/metabolite transporter (DMT)-like permease